MQVSEVKTIEWKYPPTLSKAGKSRRPFDYKHLIHVESDLFKYPVIMMSDLHQHAFEVVKRLAQTIDLSEYIVLSVGDMAGKGIFGSNGDPTPTYQFLNDNAYRFYFVQGNHDLPGNGNSHMYLKNDDGTKCMIPDGKLVHTKLGGITGINGIITRSDKSRLYKFQAEDFYELVKKSLSRGNVNVFMTHETPAIPIDPSMATDVLKKVQKHNPSVRTALIGKSQLFEMVDKYRPKVHVFGHCHHRQYTHLINGVRYFNVDSRVVIINQSD